MAARLLSLQTWANEVYGDAAPALITLRRWARNGRICPAPTKHGRSYYVQPHATYVAYSGGRLRLKDRIDGKATGRA